MFFSANQKMCFPPPINQQISERRANSYRRLKTPSVQKQLVIFSNYNTSIRQLLFKAKLGKTVPSESNTEQLDKAECYTAGLGVIPLHFHPNTAWLEMLKKSIFSF